MGSGISSIPGIDVNMYAKCMVDARLLSNNYFLQRVCNLLENFVP